MKHFRCSCDSQSVCEHRHWCLVSYNVLKITALVELLVPSFWGRGRWALFLPPAGHPSPPARRKGSTRQAKANCYQLWSLSIQRDKEKQQDSGLIATEWAASQAFWSGQRSTFIYAGTQVSSFRVTHPPQIYSTVSAWSWDQTTAQLRIIAQWFSHGGMCTTGSTWAPSVGTQVKLQCYI